MECPGPAPSPEGVRWLPSAVSPEKKTNFSFSSNIAGRENVTLAGRVFKELSRGEAGELFGQQPN